MKTVFIIIVLVLGKLVILLQSVRLYSLICICMIKIKFSRSFVNTKTKHKITYFLMPTSFAFEWNKKSMLEFYTVASGSSWGECLLWESILPFNLIPFTTLFQILLPAFIKPVLFSYSLLLRIARISHHKTKVTPASTHYISVNWWNWLSHPYITNVN